MAFTVTQKARVVELLMDYMAAPPGDEELTPKESNAQLDRNREDLINKELNPLISDYMGGSVPLSEFKSKIDSINKRSNHWGFKGIKGQMFFNMVVNVADDEEECDKELKSAIDVPANEQIASSRIKKFASYIERLGDQWVDAGNTRHGCPKPGSIPFFLSWFWQVQAPNKWPVYYTAGVNALKDLNLWQPTGDISDDYSAFKKIHEELQSLFASKLGKPVSLYSVEHVLWFKVGHPFDYANRGGDQGSVWKSAHKQEPPEASGQLTYLPESYVPPIIAVLTKMAINDKEIAEAAKRSGTSIERAFEKQIDAAFTMLGFDSKLLGQGKGRVPDGIATAQDERYAIIWDAKVRANGYSIGTDDRVIREYIQTQSRELKKKGFLRNIYYAIISSSFAEDYDDSIRSLKMETDVNEVNLIEAGALVAMVDIKLRAPMYVTLGSDGFQRLFTSSGIVTAENVRAQMN